MNWAHKKLLLLGLLVLVLLPSKSFAWDCSFVDSDKEKKVPVKYSAVFSKEDFNRAVDNLRAYCCNNYPEMPVCNLANEVDDYPQSEYLYDHLVDVAFRKLDGFTWNYVYGLEPDILWLEWRKIITKVSLSITWDIAGRIWEEYDKYRKLKWYKYNSGFLLDYNNIEKVSLSDKYYFVCDIIKDLINEDMIWREKLSDVYYDKCRAMAYKRIEDENLYVKTVMINASNQLLKSSFDAYLIKYFVQEKLSALKAKIVEFMNIFYTIYKQAPASKSCSK